MSTTSEEMYLFLLAHRGIDDACKKCNGFGMRAYGNTTTWHGGIGGQMITTDVCDECWGSGDANRKGADLRAIGTLIANLRREIIELKAQQTP